MKKKKDYKIPPAKGGYVPIGTKNPYSCWVAMFEV
jgi:hypothetical protein